MQFLSQATLVLFLFVWASWLYPFDDLLDRRGTPLGADYSMFYVSGRVVLEGAGARLYDQAEHQHRLQALFPAIDPSFCLPFRYPPFVAVLMVPLAALPYAASYGCFLALSCAAGSVSIWLLTRRLGILRGPWRRPALWAAAGMPLVWETLLGGQASLFALLILTAVVALVSDKRFALAGAALALAAYKPNVLAFVGLGLLLRYPRLLRGTIPVALILGLVGLIPAQWGGWRDYFTLSSQLALQSWDVETPFWKVHGLAAWLDLLPGLNARLCSLLLGATLTGGVAWSWRKTKVSETVVAPLAIATLISVNALFNPYTPIYDLVLLLVGSLLMAEYLALRFGQDINGRLWQAQLLLATVWFGPHLSQFVSRTTVAQPFSLALLAILAWQLRQLDLLRRGAEAPSPIPRVIDEPASAV